MNSEKPAVRFELRASHRKSLERREVEKRIYAKGNNPRLVVAFHDCKIRDKCVTVMTVSVKNCE